MKENKQEDIKNCLFFFFVKMAVNQPSPSGHMTFIQRHLNVDTKSWKKRRINVMCLLCVYYPLNVKTLNIYAFISHMRCYFTSQTSIILSSSILSNLCQSFRTQNRVVQHKRFGKPNRYEFHFSWTLSMCKNMQITHKLNKGLTDLIRSAVIQIVSDSQVFIQWSNPQR